MRLAIVGGEWEMQPKTSAAVVAVLVVLFWTPTATPETNPVRVATLDEYFENPFVQETVGSATLDRIRERHAQDPGFVGAVPSVGSGLGDEHIALIYEGPAPDGVREALPGGWGFEDGLGVRLYEAVASERLVHQLSPSEVERLLTARVLIDADPHGPILPGPGEIGPGTSIFITWPSGDTFLCTANFIFEDGLGTMYLGSAGHCLLPPGLMDGNLNGIVDSLDPGFVQPTTVEICVSLCVSSVVIGSVVTIPAASSPVFYARQSGPSLTIAGSTGFGQDFGFIELPVMLEPYVRPWVWTWGGPTEKALTPVPNGQPVVHYGHGTNCGTTAATQARAGVGMGAWFDVGSFWALGVACGGDSGSPVERAAVRAELLFADQAVGDLTHSIVLVGAPLFIGTLVEQAQMFTAASTGTALSLMLEDGTLVP